MALTKTQINYLSDKLERVVHDKTQQFRNKLGLDKCVYEIAVERIISGEIPLPSRKKFFETLTSKIGNNYYTFYCPSFTLSELIYKNDYDNIVKEVQEKEKVVNNYIDKLEKAKQDALDKIVLEGVDVETAITELNKIEV